MNIESTDRNAELRHDDLCRGVRAAYLSLQTGSLGTGPASEAKLDGGALQRFLDEQERIEDESGGDSWSTPALREHLLNCSDCQALVSGLDLLPAFIAELSGSASAEGASAEGAVAVGGLPEDFRELAVFQREELLEAPKGLELPLSKAPAELDVRVGRLLSFPSRVLRGSFGDQRAVGDQRALRVRSWASLAAAAALVALLYLQMGASHTGPKIELVYVDSPYPLDFSAARSGQNGPGQNGPAFRASTENIDAGKKRGTGGSGR